MPVREVLMVGNPKIRVKSENIKNFDTELKPILEDLKDTLRSLQKTKKLGRALAAPQISYLKKVIFFNLPSKSFVMINPKILWKSKQKIKVWDSCYSFDIAFFIEIERFKRIEVEFFDEKGKKSIQIFDNGMSELVQHEIDHLDGILATDHFEDNSKIMMRSEWEKRYH